jgi:hypothetical protein
MFFDLPSDKTCIHPEHDPPTGLYIPPGKGYRHVCPACKTVKDVIPPDYSSPCPIQSGGPWCSAGSWCLLSRQKPSSLLSGVGNSIRMRQIAGTQTTGASTCTCSPRRHCHRGTTRKS